jgi:hypothetical protein
MRRIILFSAFALIVGSAHAQGTDPTTAAAPVAPAAPVTPAASAPKPESAPAPTAASPEAPTPQATPSAEALPIAKPAKKHVAKHETDGHKARRIAAKYGVYW